VRQSDKWITASAARNTHFAASLYPNGSEKAGNEVVNTNSARLQDSSSAEHTWHEHGVTQLRTVSKDL